MSAPQYLANVLLVATDGRVSDLGGKLLGIEPEEALGSAIGVAVRAESEAARESAWQTVDVLIAAGVHNPECSLTQIVGIGRLAHHVPTVLAAARAALSAAEFGRVMRSAHKKFIRQTTSVSDRLQADIEFRRIFGADVQDWGWRDYMSACSSQPACARVLQLRMRGPSLVRLCLEAVAKCLRVPTVAAILADPDIGKFINLPARRPDDGPSLTILSFANYALRSLAFDALEIRDMYDPSDGGDLEQHAAMDFATRHGATDFAGAYRCACERRDNLQAACLQGGGLQDAGVAYFEAAVSGVKKLLRRHRELEMVRIFGIPGSAELPAPDHFPDRGEFRGWPPSRDPRGGRPGEV